MASEGIGKIKPKKSHQSKKPYERSSSFLGKIKDSVKDLLIPSWLVRSSDALSEKTEASTSSQYMVPNDGCNGPVTRSPSFRQSTSIDDHVFSVNEIQGQQQSRLPLQSGTESGRFGLRGKLPLNNDGPAPNVNIAALEQQNFTWHGQNESPISRLTSAFQQGTKKKTVDAAGLRMSDSYLEESIDTASSTTPTQVMMSSTIPKKYNPKSGTSQLWSSEAARLRKALVPPVKDKPAFNAALAASTSKASTEGYGDSSFYSGKTCYGGSSARRRRNMNTSLPYQSSLPLRKQVTAHKLNTSLNATTSSTAQRILETLDKMSTPLGDAKRIPQDESTNDSIISFTPSSYRRTSSIGSLRSVTRPLQLPSKGPPTSQHKALAQAELARNRNIVASVDRRQVSAARDSDFIITQEPSAVRESIRPSHLPEQPSQAAASSSSGKLKSKKFSQHVSNRKDEEEQMQIPNLRTDFTLPITSINPISFSQTIKGPTSVANSIPSRVDASALQFTFSTPIKEKAPSSGNQLVNSSQQGFKFSSPIKASQTKANAAGAEEGSKTTPEPAVGASSELPPLNFSSPVSAWGSTAPKPKQGSPDIGGTSSSFKSYNKWSGFQNGSSAAPDVSSAAGFSLSPATSLKSGSVMDILGGKSTSSGAAAQVTTTSQNGVDVTPKSAAKAIASLPGTNDLMAKFIKPAGSWECDTCMLSNKPEAVKCIACETPKPVAKSQAPISSPPKVLSTQGTDELMAKFMKPAGSWECDTCMLSNKPEALKCIACEAPKPGAISQSGTADSSNNSLAAMFQKPAGSWECDTCMVQNVPSASRCVACDSPKPGLEAAGIVSKSSESSKSAVTLAPGGGFVFNAPLGGSASTATSGFKFGNSVSTPSNNPPAATGFVFGQTSVSTSVASSSAVASSSFSGGFKFGSTASTSNTSSGVIGASQSSAGSTFGSQSMNKTSTAASFQFGNSQNAISDSFSGKTISPVVEVAPTDKLNSSTNGISADKTQNSTGLVFGGTPATLAFPSFTNPTQSTTQSAVAQSQKTFSFSAAPVSSPAAQLTNAKPASNLFQFGATPAGSAANSSTALGMAPSVASGKSVLNGGISAPLPSGQTDSTVAGNAAVKSGIPTFGGFGQNTFSSNQGSPYTQHGGVAKRTSGFEEGGAPSAKMFNFGSSKEATVNGGFHFGGAAQSSAPGFGVNAAAASASAPTGGFTFGASTKPSALPQSGPAAGGGFQFNTDAPGSTSFNFGQAAGASNLAFKAGGLTANFNFGGGSQSSSAPFQFGAKPPENAASAAATFAAPQIPQLNGPSFGGAPSNMGSVGSFNLGVGDSQRRVKKAVRRIKK